MHKLIYIFLLSTVLLFGLLACTGGDPTSSVDPGGGGGGDGSLTLTLSWSGGGETNPDICASDDNTQRTYMFTALVTDDNGCSPNITAVDWCWDYTGSSCTLGNISNCDTSNWFTTTSCSQTDTTYTCSTSVTWPLAGTSCTSAVQAGNRTFAVRITYTCSGSSLSKPLTETEAATIVNSCI